MCNDTPSHNRTTNARKIGSATGCIRPGWLRTGAGSERSECAVRDPTSGITVRARLR